MTFWKKLTQPPRVEPYPEPPASSARPDPDDIFTALGVGLSTWIVAESLGGTVPEIAALVAYPYAIRMAAEYGANQPQADSRDPGTTPQVQ